MSLLNGINSLGFVMGIKLGSVITQYWTVFLLSFLFGSAGLLYTVFVLREAREPERVKPTTVLELSHIKDSLRTVFGQHRSHSRPLLLVLLCSFLALMICLNTSDFDYLMTRLKFDWTASEWSDYLIVQRVIRLTSLIALLPFLSFCLGVSDNLIIIAGLAVTMSSYSLMSLATQDWMVYTSALLQMNSMTSVTIRSEMSKLVGPSEVGRMFSVVGVGQAVMALLSQSVLGSVYRLTLSTFPTAYLLPVITALAISLTALIVVVSRNRQQEPHLEEDNVI